MRPWPSSAGLLIAVSVAAAPVGVDAQPVPARQAPPAEAPALSGAEVESGDAAGGKFAMPPGIRVERDLAYGAAAGQKIDIYLPGTKGNAPILLMVHGGGWMFGDKGNAGSVANKVRHWLPRGYIVASANYRMARPPSPLEQAEDVGRALAFVQANASSWGGDPKRVVLIGHSSGAHLVALVTASPAIAARSGARPWLGSIALDSAALDLVGLMNARHPRLHDRVFGADPAGWAELSPLHQLASRPVPMLLVCSTRRNDSCAAARRFADKAVSLGGRALALPVDLTHGEINSELGRSAGYTAPVEEFLRSLGLP